MEMIFDFARFLLEAVGEGNGVLLIIVLVLSIAFLLKAMETLIDNFFARLSFERRKKAFIKRYKEGLRGEALGKPPTLFISFGDGSFRLKQDPETLIYYSLAQRKKNQPQFVKQIG